jgi:predicted permease
MKWIGALLNCPMSSVCARNLRGLGGLKQTRKSRNQKRWSPPLQEFVQDARYTMRQWQRAPGFALFTVLVLALGIGTVTAMFTITYGVLLKPLPFRNSERLFQPVERTAKGDDDFSVSFGEIRDMQQSTRDTSEIAFYAGGFNILDTSTGALVVSQIEASPNLFELLGIEPLMGRSFRSADDPHSVLLSYAMWRQRFSGDQNILAKSVHIGSASYIVVGVMPPQFEFPIHANRPQLWVPLDQNTQIANDPYSRKYVPIVRLHVGIPIKAVAAQLETDREQLRGQGGNTKIQLVGLHDLLVADVRPALTALIIAVVVVWLIACSNVASLLLAKVVARRSEIAIRFALGARKRRILSQFLIESLLLSATGALGGLGMALTMLHLFRHMFGTLLPLSQNIQLNWAVWAALVLVTLLTALVFGTFPAIVASQTGMNEALKIGGRTTMGDRGQNRVRSFLLVGEFALSISLLIGAALMMRTMYALRHAPLGFRTDHLVLISLTAPGDLYRGKNVGSVAWKPILEAVRRLPGVQMAALSTVMPIEHPVELRTVVYATEWTEGDVSATVRAASPELAHVLGIPMRTGRFFAETDTAGSLPVMVVNRAFVNRYLGGGDALGKQIRFGRVPQTATVIGVIGDIHQDKVAESSQPEIYLCMSQLGLDHPMYQALLGQTMQLAIRTDNAPGLAIPGVRQSIQHEDSHLAIDESTTMEQGVEDSLGTQRLATGVVGVFGGLALLITIFGLYGLLSYLVAQRTREIGIRMALGADRSAVVCMVMFQSFVLMGAGSTIGICLAFWSNRLLNGFLYGVSQTDPWTMVLVPLGLFGCGIAVSIVPSRNAASIDPIQALRSE